VQRAKDRALESGYGALVLRALSLAADEKLDAGDWSQAGKLTSAGLGRYWSGEFPVMRGYSLYAQQALLAEEKVQPSLQVAVWREAVALIDFDSDVLLRGMVHNALARAATAAHQPQFAQQEYAMAGKLYARSPLTGASRNFALENEIVTAQMEARLGHFDDAIKRLTRIQSDVRPLSNSPLLQVFYST